MMAPTLAAMEQLNHVGRYLHPPALPSLVDGVAGAHEALRHGLGQFRETLIPEELEPFKRQVESVVGHVCKALDGLSACSGDDPNEVYTAYQALRHHTRAVEALYPTAPMLPAVSRYF